MKTIRAANDKDIQEFCRRLGYSPCVDIKGIVQTDKDTGKVVAMVGYDHWLPASCEMHVWVSSGHPVSRPFIREALNYPFSNGRTVIIGRTPSWNIPALIFNKRIGFRVMWRCVNGYGSLLGEPNQLHSLVFHELRHTDVAKWFPPHIIDKYYAEVPWLREAQKKWSSTKIPPLNPGEIYGPNSPIWKGMPLPARAMTSSEREVFWKMDSKMDSRLESPPESEMEKFMRDSMENLKIEYIKSLAEAYVEESGLADKTSLPTTDSPSSTPEKDS